MTNDDKFLAEVEARTERAQSLEGLRHFDLEAGCDAWLELIKLNKDFVMAEIPRLIAMVRERDAEIVRLNRNPLTQAEINCIESWKRDEMIWIQQEKDLRAEVNRLRKQLDVAREAMEVPFRCVICGYRTNRQWGRSCTAVDDKCCSWQLDLGTALAELDRLERESTQST